jgi:hypothetical protein
LTSASLMANFDVRFSMIMSLAAMVASLAVLSAARVRWSHLWLYYRQLGFRWSHLWLYYLQLDFSPALWALEGIVTTVRVRKVFSLCRQILKDIIMANQEVDAIKGRISWSGSNQSTIPLTQS